MNKAFPQATLGMTLLPALCVAQSAFNGTWRPDPEKPDKPRPAEVFELSKGTYDCQACKPPYKIKADGHDQPIVGNSYYDTVSVSIIDDRTVTTVAKKNGEAVIENKITVSMDGTRKTELLTITHLNPAVVVLTRQSSRMTAAAPGSHLVSGGWQWNETVLTNNAEDTIYKVEGAVLLMSDQMGRSYSAKLDGSKAPYKGEPDFTGVTLKLIDPHTIEESDWKADKVVKISLWTVGADGQTIHARFDDTKGHIQNQNGHKIQN